MRAWRETTDSLLNSLRFWERSATRHQGVARLHRHQPLLARRRDQQPGRQEYGRAANRAAGRRADQSRPVIVNSSPGSGGVASEEDAARRAVVVSPQGPRTAVIRCESRTLWCSPERGWRSGERLGGRNRTCEWTLRRPKAFEQRTQGLRVRCSGRRVKKGETAPKAPSNLWEGSGGRGAGARRWPIPRAPATRRGCRRWSGC